MFKTIVAMSFILVGLLAEPALGTIVITLSGNATTITATSCMKFTASLSSNGQAYKATSTTSLSMSNARSGRFYLDSQCTSRANGNVKIYQGYSSADFWYSDSIVENPKIRASYSDYTAGTLSVTVVAGPSIATSSLPTGISGSTYTAVLTGSGGVSPYAWTISSGGLPSGLSLSGSGTISSALDSSASSSTFTVNLTDADGVMASQTLTIQVEAPIVISTTTVPQGIRNASYSTTLSATGGVSPLYWALYSGALPDGMTLSSSGVLSGTPKAGSTSTFSVQAYDSLQSATQALTLTVANFGTATKVVFSTEPSGGQADKPLTSFTVKVKDAYGNIVTSSTDNISVSFGSNPTAGLLTGTLSVAAVAGVATFNNVIVDPAAAGYTLVATDTSSSLKTDTSMSFTVSGPGAGKTSYTCPTSSSGGGVVWNIGPNDDLGTIITTNGQVGDTFCIQGEHRVSSTVILKDNQTLIGLDSNSRISGAVQLTGWVADSTGVWKYSGSYATGSNLPHMLTQFSGTTTNCYSFSAYQDDLFYRDAGQNNDQRMVRVMSKAELTGSITTPGQAGNSSLGLAPLSEERGRFYFDYTNGAIYINLDPTNAVVDLAVVDTVVKGQGKSNITFENLFVEKALTYDILGGPSWTVKDSTFRFSHNIGFSGGRGSTSSSPFTMDNILFTSNGQYGMSGQGNWLSITNSEMSWNNMANYRAVGDAGIQDSNCKDYSGAGAVKFDNFLGTSLGIPSVSVSNLDSHHNIGDGIWDDDGGQYAVITNSHLHDNERNGLNHEISCDVSFTNNEVDHNGNPMMNTDLTGGGVWVNTSSNGTFSNNIIHDNTGSALMFVYQQGHASMKKGPCFQASSDTDTSKADMNNTASANSIYVCSPNTGAIGGKWGNGGTLASRNNSFSGNSYFVGDSAENWWQDAGITEPWSYWQGVDKTGSMTASCTY